jgi:hypothetical protein
LGDRPLEDVCVALAVVWVVQLDPALAALLAAHRRTFARLFQDLKNTFTEFAA